MLSGRVGERNAGFLARSLADHGIRVERTVIVGDRLEDVRDGVTQLVATGVDLLCTTGGLGPTFDDLTMAAVAEATGRPLAVSAEALAMVEARSRSVARRFGADEPSLDRMRRKQASLPEGSEVLPPAGTAPGCVFMHGATLIVVLPGPPWELQAMWHAAVAAEGPVGPFLAAAPGAGVETLRLWAVVEAELIGVLEELEPSELDVIGTYAREGELEVVVPSRLAGRVADLLDGAFERALFARDERHVDDIVAESLALADATLAVAESCTGGGLGGRLTARPGSSEWFVGGIIAYSNDLKVRLLGVDPAIIERHGAVSSECAAAMAEGARRVTGATWAIAITGVAGPSGGTPEKPVGLVWIGLSGPAGAQAFEHRFWRGDREGVRRRAQTAALHHLRIALGR